MTTFIPRQSYSQAELDKLYPKELELQLVQVVCELSSHTLCNAYHRQGANFLQASAPWREIAGLCSVPKCKVDIAVQ